MSKETIDVNYIKDFIKLSNVIKTLAEHELVVKQYFLAEIKPRVTILAESEDKLGKLFILANADRMGTGKGNENLVQATATFIKYLNENIFDRLRGMEPKDAHHHLLTCLCDIKGMDQKTANLFLKYVVMFQDELNLCGIDWHSWELYLHVPLDLWVLRLIGKDYLSVCGNNFENDFQYKGDYASPSLKTRKYSQLQDDIREVAASTNLPAITLDSLWFVGSKYCGYHPLLCDICWFGQYCVKHNIVDWNKVPATLKSTELEERKKIAKSSREIIRIWKSENPGKTDGDFSQFLKEPKGKEWLSKFFSR